MKPINNLIMVMLFGCLSLLCGSIVQADNSTQAVWVFPDDLLANPVTDPSAQQRLVDNSRVSGVNALYVSVYQPTPNTAGRRMYEDSDIAALIRQARRNRIRVWVAYGSPDWAARGCDPGKFPLTRMAEVVDYNDDNPSAKIKGVVLDVEPPELQSEADFQKLLTLYQCVRDSLPNYMGLGVAIRFFWDTDVLYQEYRKPAYQHIIDLDLDKIIVMGYRDFADTADGIIYLDQDEIAYADSIAGKRRDRILVGLETSNCVDECGPDKVTFFEEGQDELNIEAYFVMDHFDKNASFGGFAIHRYRDSYLGVEGEEDPEVWPVVNPEFP